MPTENRSSNTEQMVNVPLVELQRLQENMDPHRGAVAWGIVCNLLERPTQHQGNSKLVDSIRSLLALDASGALVPHGIGGLARELLESSAIRLSAQHQGEPVALPERKGTHLRYDTLMPTFSKGWNAYLDEIAKLGPLYTHADTGDLLYAAQMLAISKNECGRLRAELAERDSLLRRWVGNFGHLGGCATPLRDDTKAALSASAEPAPAADGFSAGDMADQGADGYRNGIKAAAKLAEAYPELAHAIRALPLPQ